MTRIGHVLLLAVTLSAPILLGACNSQNAQTIQARAEARGTATPLPRMEDWSFGGRAQTPGFAFDRGFSGSGA